MDGQHWAAGRSPFAGNVEEAGFYSNPVHDEALARMQFLIDGRRRLGLLLGPSGSGKSLLLAVLSNSLRRAGRPVVRLGLTGVEPGEFSWLVAAGLGLNPRGNDPPVKLWRMISDRIAENRYQQLATTILLDDADQAAPQLSGAILRLAQLDQTSGAALTLILSAGVREAARLKPRLVELCELRIDLEPWDAEVTAGYLTAAQRQAGEPGLAFEPQALERLYRLSGGIPRRVRQLADLAMLAAAGEHQERVDITTIDAVYRDLSTGHVLAGSA